MESSGNVDAAFTALRPLGLFTIIQYVILSTATWPSSINLFTIVFQGQDNPFICHGSPPGTLFQNKNGSWTPNASYSTTVLFNESEYFTSNCTTSGLCDSVDYLLPKDRFFVSEFDLVCDRQYLAGLSQTLFTVGNLVGALTFPTLADAYGRKPVLIIASMFLLVSSLGLAFSLNYVMFVVAKFFLGVFSNGIEVSSFCALTELMVPRYRTAFVAFGATINWTLSSCCLAPLAYWLKDCSWKYLQFAISSTSIFIFLYIFVLDETLQWLTANGRKEKVIHVLTKASRWNDVDVRRVLNAYTPGTSKVENNEDKHEVETNRETNLIVSRVPKEYELKSKAIFTHIYLRKYSIFFCIAWFFNGMTYIALTLLSSTLPGNIYVNYALSIAIEVPASLYIFFFLDKVGRRKSVSLLSVIAGLSLIMLGVVWNFAPHQEELILALSCLGKLASFGSYCVLYIYAPELYPTNLRNTGTSVGFLSSRVGEMLAPYSEMLMQQAVYAPGVLFGVSCLLVGVGTYFLPETSGLPLPQSLADVERRERCRSEDLVRQVQA